MSTPKVFLITGANRGLGLEHVRQVLALGPDIKVIAASRKIDPNDELAGLQERYPGRVERLEIDVSDRASIKRAGEEAQKLSIAKEGIDVLHADAGYLGNYHGPLESDSIDILAEAVKINMVGTAATIEAFLPLLEKGQGKQIWATSTQAAAFVNGWADQEVAAGYNASKAGLNHWLRKLHAALSPKGYTVIAYSPGWVKTAMGGPDAQLEIEPSVASALKMLLARKPEDGNKFWNFSGEQLEW